MHASLSLCTNISVFSSLLLSAVVELVGGSVPKTTVPPFNRAFPKWLLEGYLFSFPSYISTGTFLGYNYG